MEWPEELLHLFEDPLLEGVHPKAKTPTPDDRLLSKLEEITQWAETNGRKPEPTGKLKEKLLYATLKALQDENNEQLKAHDRLGLLNN